MNSNTAMNSNTEQKQIEAVCLKVQRSGGDELILEIAAGEMLLVGSGNSCAMVLAEDSVAAMHCTMSFIDGLVRVRDWNTATGTFVDGNRIDAETVVPGGAEIRVGSYRMEIVCSETPDSAAAIQALDKVDSLLEEASVIESPEPAAFDEQEAADDELVLDAASTRKSESYDSTGPIEGDNSDPFEDDTLELLKAEVELLQSELAERDARLTELENLADFDSEFRDPSHTEDSPEMVVLVERLEQLLLELERGDERMVVMADLLRAADDANAAEVEERRQIEAWIGEIERRLTEREAERRAEKQVLQQTVADLTKQLERAERQLDKAATGGKATVDQDNYVAQMRNEYAALEEKCQQTEAERDRLHARLDAVDAESAETRTQAAIEDALREERLTIAQERTEFSQERAAFARERAELSRLRDELDDERQKLGADPDNADQRIRELRDHLREIHETETPAEQSQGLSARIGKLWRRLEGRPLDTD